MVLDVFGWFLLDVAMNLMVSHGFPMPLDPVSGRPFAKSAARGRHGATQLRPGGTQEGPEEAEGQGEEHGAVSRVAACGSARVRAHRLGVKAVGVRLRRRRKSGGVWVAARVFHYMGGAFIYALRRYNMCMAVGMRCGTTTGGGRATSV